MTILPNQFDLSLAHKAMFSVADASGVNILCREGCLWVTLDNDPRDVILVASESFLSPQHRRALIYAMEPSTLSLVVAPAAASKRRPAKVQPAGGVQLTLAPELA